MRQGLVILGAIALLATTRCSTGSSDVSGAPAPGPQLAGSSTPSMASVTGRQDLGMYNPYMGTKVYDTATPPPGHAYGR